MSGLWRRTLIYLGLLEEPEDHDDVVDEVAAPTAAPPTTATPASVHPLRPEPGSPHVRPLVPTEGTRLATVRVTRFDDVEQVGMRFRNGQPVLIDLRGVDTAIGRRVLDFVSGMTYALRGRLQAEGRRLYVLLPEGVELTAEDRERVRTLTDEAGTR